MALHCIFLQYIHMYTSACTVQYTQRHIYIWGDRTDRDRGQRHAGQSQCEKFLFVILIAVPLTGSNMRGSSVINLESLHVCFLIFLHFLGRFFSNQLYFHL